MIIFRPGLWFIWLIIFKNTFGVLYLLVTPTIKQNKKTTTEVHAELEVWFSGKALAQHTPGPGFDSQFCKEKTATWKVLTYS